MLAKTEKVSRRIFLVLEAVLLISWSLFWWGSSARTGDVQYFSGYAIVLLTFSLLLAGPFFIRSLRGIALSGWILAFISFFLCLTIFP
jgi:hypothetical protein